MEVTGLNIYLVALESIRQVDGSLGSNLNTNQKILVRAHSSAVSGWGEISLVDVGGYTAYSTTDCWHQFDSASDVLLKSIRSAPNPERWDVLSRLQFPPLYPALRFAISEALWDLEATRAGDPLHSFYRATPTPCRVRKVIGGKDALHHLCSACEAGYQAVKLKVDTNTDKDQIQNFKAGLFGRSASVDCNQCEYDYTFLDSCNFSFIEEPLPTVAPSLYTPICLDESIAEPKALDGISREKILNIKPFRWGSITETRALLTELSAQQRPWFIGGMFETGIGRSHLITLAACFQTAGLPVFHDLSLPQEIYQLDILDTPLTIDTNGCIPTADSPGIGSEVNPELLKRFQRAMIYTGEPADSR